MRIATVRRNGLCLVAGLLLGVAGSAAWGAQGVVHLRDGQVVEGDITEGGNPTRPDEVMVMSHGVRTVLTRDAIASIDYPPAIQEQYNQRLAALPKNQNPKDAAVDHLKLARWLFDNKEYDLSRTELDKAAELDPNNADVQTFFTTVQSQMRMEKRSTSTPASPDAVDSSAAAPNPPQASSPLPQKVVTPLQINLIRQAEWKPGDGTVRVRLDNDLKQRFAQYNSAKEDPAAFAAKTPTDQGAEILAVGTPDMHKDVKILNDPAPLADYRRTVQPVVLSGCATSGCHGGGPGGNLFLYPVADNEATAYTNFMTLQQYAKVINGVKYQMIDRSVPERSLLLQYGLAASAADIAHPQVQGYHGLFHNRTDPRYREMTGWIGRTLKPVPPDYGFKFDPPVPTTRPAASTKPAH